jgi:hypothetical protein
VATSQDPVVRALSDPATYGCAPEGVEHLQTHISHVFLAGPYVYKLKKAVRFPFLDFSTLARRRAACDAEVRLNRRLCPAVYLDVLPVTDDGRGRLRLGGTGRVVDHVVRMRRLPADGMLPQRIESDRVRPEWMDELARLLAAFHASAPTGPAVAAHADPDLLARHWEEEAAATAAFAGRLLPPEDHEVLADFGPWFVRTHEALLRARQGSGHVREGHGDLHAANVCLVGVPVTSPADLPPLAPGPYVFDCIEFSHALRCNDVAAEVAFLAMDLEARGRPDLSRRFVDAYVAATGDTAVRVLLPFYGAHRAVIRGKVEGLASDAPALDAGARAAAADQARRHFALAARYAWEPGGPAVIACGGLSGTGKSTLAAALAAVTGFSPISTDAIRRRAGGAGVVPFGEGRYTPAARAATYDALCAEVDRTLGEGHGVIADATFLRRADRAHLADVARRHRRPLVFVECVADENVVRARLAARQPETSLSDARWDTYLTQRRQREPFDDAHPPLAVDTSAGVPAARRAAISGLWQWRRARPGTHAEL